MHKTRILSIRRNMFSFLKKKRKQQVLPDIEEYRAACNRSYLLGNDIRPVAVKTDNLANFDKTRDEELEYKKNYLERMKIYYEFTGRGGNAIFLKEAEIRLMEDGVI